MKIFTIGKGFVSEHLKYKNIENVRLDFSIKQIDQILETYKPDVLINCIGRTGKPNIDQCESIKEETFATNTALPILLADACAKKSIHLIQIGSGCIFFGESPHTQMISTNHAPFLDKIDLGWKESDFANPQSTYSKSKYACDIALGDMKNVCTLRIRMPISTKNHPRNLINKLLNYKQVIDIQNSMTMMSDFEKCIDWVIENGKTGIFHATNPGTISAWEIMKEYQKYVPAHNFVKITEQQLDKLTIAKRSNCILDSNKLRDAGFAMTPAKQALVMCMAEYIKNI